MFKKAKAIKSFYFVIIFFLLTLIINITLLFDLFFQQKVDQCQYYEFFLFFSLFSILFSLFSLFSLSFNKNVLLIDNKEIRNKENSFQRELIEKNLSSVNRLFFSGIERNKSLLS